MAEIPTVERQAVPLEQPPTMREFGDVPATRQLIFDNVLAAFKDRYPVSNERYTLELADLKYRAPKDFNPADQKKAIMRGRTLGWNMTGQWRLVDNATSKVVDKMKSQLVMQVPYLTDRGTFIFNGNEYTVASQMRLRPGVYSRVKENGLIEAHFNVKGGTGPSFRVHMEPETGIFRMHVGQANLKLYPILRSMGFTDKALLSAWGRDLLHANVAAADPRAVQRAHAKLVVPRMEKAARYKHSKLSVNYVQVGTLQQCMQCYLFEGLNSCQVVQGFIAPQGWCVLWNTPGMGKFAQDADAQRARVKFVGTIVCDDSKSGKQWIYLKVHPGLVQAAWQALDEQDVNCEPRFDKPHITVLKHDETMALIEKYGNKWKQVCGNGRRVQFSLQNAMVNLDPEGWDTMDRVWFLEIRSPQLRAFRKSLDLPELPQGDDGEQPFHITVAVQPKAKRERGASTLDTLFNGEDDQLKAAFATIEQITKLAWLYRRVEAFEKRAGCTPANTADHEAKCHHCGDCCSIKIAMEDTVCDTGVYCPFLDKESKLCDVYDERFDVNPICHPIDALFKIGMAPKHCGYALDYAGYTSKLTTVPPNGIVKQLAQELADTLVKRARQRRGTSNGTVLLPFSLEDKTGSVVALDSPQDTMLAKLAAVVDLSDPIEELGDSAPELLERQQEAARMLRDNPAAPRTEGKAELATVLPHKAKPKLTQKEREQVEQEDVKAAWKALIGRYDYYFTKKADTEYGPQIQAVFERMELDEDTTEQTLGQRSKNVSPTLIVDVTKKLIDINQGRAETDDRDSLAFQRILGPEDLFSERVARDAGGTGRRILWRSTLKSNVQHIAPGVLSPQMRSLLLKSGLASPLEEVNPLEIFDQQVRVTRMGEGGMSSNDAVPDEARNVQPSHFGTIDPIRAPEGMKIGVDSRISHKTYKGSDGKLYADMIDTKSGELKRVSAQELAHSAVAFPGELARKSKKVRAMVNSRQLAYIDRKDVDYELPHTSHMFTATSNLVPMVSAIKGGRLLMGAKMATQALPLRDPETPFVQNAYDIGKGSFENMYGERVGAIRAQGPGFIEEITRDHIKVRYAGGDIVKHPLYNNFPFNRKTYLHNTPAVKIGDRVDKGALLAKSNYTDNEGSIAIGKNMRVAYMAYKGFNADDAIVISESAAQQLSSEHMYTSKFKPADNQEVDKRAFLSLFPGRFDKRQMGTIDANGIVKPGTVVNFGDPLVLAVEKRKPRGGGVIRSRKMLYTDVADTWEHEAPGTVTDVDRMKGGWKVLTKAYSPMLVGDKLSNRYGGKGVVSKIVADDQMPHDKDGSPIEIILSPLGVVSRVNPAQLIETALGKVSKKTGKPYKLQGFMDESYIDFAKRELQRAGLSDTEDLIDPLTSRKIPKVFTGHAYIMKLHHMAEPKAAGRDVGAYTAEGIPAGGGQEGAKRIGTGELSALLSHGATNLLRDAKVVRGQRNDDYWRALRLGYPPPSPKVPLVYEKFLAHLQGAGINLKKKGDVTHLFASTDETIDQLSAGPITVPETVRGDRLDPIAGGLFDVGKTGGHG
ncbi:hypothetical protein LCGC14_0917720, partial [marine sediment metagenome]